MSEHQAESMRHYYRIHAGIYDATRWTFLFGRKAILKKLPYEREVQQTLLEVGCGTGHNLSFLARRYPNFQLIGMDVSADMLAQAAKRLTRYSRRTRLLEKAYGTQPCALAPDAILFSYALTMFNPGWEAAIECAWNDLPPGGRIAVVDFHDSPSRLFRWWMAKNHVRMEGHLLPALQSRFRTEFLGIRPAWQGLWRYTMFIGVKEGN
ncbi:MAG: class I SAM-dependent methyltransferase [Saprospiraceae bacterium]|nr:class I SAM-dependent methyltransferase [Saprospiraceae bacterium]